jgi:hypothetical protein
LLSLRSFSLHGQPRLHRLLFDTTSHTVVEQPSKYALTGGTDAYAKARGEIRELHNPSNDRELRIVL